MKRVNQNETKSQPGRRFWRQSWITARSLGQKMMVLVGASVVLGLGGSLVEQSTHLWSHGRLVSGVARAQEPESDGRWQQVFGLFERLLGEGRDDVADDQPRTSRGDVCLIAPNVPFANAPTHDTDAHNTNIQDDNGATIDSEVGDSEVGNSAVGDSEETPATAVAYVWSRQPTFVWTGRAGAIALRTANDDTIIAEETVLGRWFTTYNHDPLDLDTTYEWVVNPATPSEEHFVATFQTLPVEQYEAINADLDAIEQSFANDETNPEAIALARAEYFADQDLWADMWQEVLAVENPSDELMRSLLDVLNQPCQFSAIAELPQSTEQ